MTKQPKRQTAMEPDDPAVQAEWRRLEERRLAEERAEAREDAEEAAHQPVARRSHGRWPLVAFLIALVAGIIAAIIVNRPRPQSKPQDSKAAAISRDTGVWGDDAAAADAGRRLVRVASTAEVPPDRLVVRVGLRDNRSRDRLEAILAASGLRIEGDLAAVAEAAKAAEGAVAAERLAVSGRPESVDRLLDALAASSAVLAIEAEGLLAEPAAEQPPVEESPAQPVSTESASTKPPATQADAEANQPAPAAAAAPQPPGRVRLWIELVELPAEPSALPAEAVSPAEAAP